MQSGDADEQRRSETKNPGPEGRPAGRAVFVRRLVFRCSRRVIHPIYGLMRESVRDALDRRGHSCSSRLSGEAHRDPIVFDLVFPAELVGQFLPGGGDAAGALLRRPLARECLLQLILGNAGAFEDSRDARLDRRVRMVV